MQGVAKVIGNGTSTSPKIQTSSNVKVVDNGSVDGPSTAPSGQSNSPKDAIASGKMDNMISEVAKENPVGDDITRSKRGNAGVDGFLHKEIERLKAEIRESESEALNRRLQIQKQKRQLEQMHEIMKEDEKNVQRTPSSSATFMEKSMKDFEDKLATIIEELSNRNKTTTPDLKRVATGPETNKVVEIPEFLPDKNSMSLASSKPNVQGQESNVNPANNVTQSSSGIPPQSLSQQPSTTTTPTEPGNVGQTIAAGKERHDRSFDGDSAGTGKYDDATSALSEMHLARIANDIESLGLPPEVRNRIMASCSGLSDTLEAQRRNMAHINESLDSDIVEAMKTVVTPPPRKSNKNEVETGIYQKFLYGGLSRMSFAEKQALRKMLPGRGGEKRKRSSSDGLPISKSLKTLQDKYAKHRTNWQRVDTAKGIFDSSTLPKQVRVNASNRFTSPLRAQKMQRMMEYMKQQEALYRQDTELVNHVENSLL